MKYILILFLLPLIAFSQGGFIKGKKGDDYRIVSKNGYHFAFGPTYMLSSESITGDLSNTLSVGDFETNPVGQFGAFAEFGFLQFPSWKGTQIKFLKKK